MDYDVAVVGGGPAGLSCALSLANIGLNVIVIDKQTLSALAKPENDGREIALTHLSRDILRQLQVWSRLAEESITPLNSAEVQDGDSPYTLTFNASESEQKPLGFLVSNYQIRSALYQTVLETPNITLKTEVTVDHVETNSQCAHLRLSNGTEVSCQLIVAADSRFSSLRQKMGISADLHDFGRSAILCEMRHEKSHRNVAVECFHYGGTLAILPMSDEHHCSVVMTVKTDQEKALLAMDEKRFSAEVTRRLGRKLGTMTQVGNKHHYPLVGVHSQRFYQSRFVLVGDAAVGMHPVTAQGFNLGLSGQDLLTKAMKRAIDKGQDFASDLVLARYQMQHMAQTRLLYHGTNHIVNLFTDDSLPMKLLRKTVLRASQHLPPVHWLIRQQLTRQKQPFLGIR